MSGPIEDILSQFPGPVTLRSSSSRRMMAGAVLGVVSAVALIYAGIMGRGLSTGRPQPRLTKTYAQAVAPLIPELGSGTPPEGPDHSDAIVVVDRWGNIASVTHTINTILWGDTGMVVGGVPLADSAGYMQGHLASLVPGCRIRLRQPSRSRTASLILQPRRWAAP